MSLRMDINYGPWPGSISSLRHRLSVWKTGP